MGYNLKNCSCAILGSGGISIFNSANGIDMLKKTLGMVQGVMDSAAAQPPPAAQSSDLDEPGAMDLDLPSGGSSVSHSSSLQIIHIYKPFSLPSESGFIGSSVSLFFFTKYTHI